MWRVAGVPNPSVGSQSPANPMGFTVTQPFDSAGRRGESKSGARGGSLLGAEIAAAWLRRGPGRGLALQRCRRHHPGVSDSGGKRSGCRSAAHSTWVTPATGLRFWRLWRLLICMPTTMPPNTRAGLGSGGVLPVLFAWHKLTGPREIRKPSWVLAGESSVNLSEEGQGEIP